MIKILDLREVPMSFKKFPPEPAAKISTYGPLSSLEAKIRPLPVFCFKIIAGICKKLKPDRHAVEAAGRSVIVGERHRVLKPDSLENMTQSGRISGSLPFAGETGRDTAAAFY